MTTITKIFESLGLSQKSQSLYEIILERGPISAAILAKELNMPRATVYLQLNTLQDLGLVSITGSFRKRKFLPEKPENLVKLLKNRSERLSDLVPLAEKIVKELEEKLMTRKYPIPEIKFFRGSEGIKKVLDSTLEAKRKEVLGIIPVYDLYQAVGTDYIDRLIARRVKNGIRAKNIWPKGKELPKGVTFHREQLRDIRFSTITDQFSSAIVTFDNTVIFITSAEELFSVQIKSHDLAQAIKVLFELLWDKSESQNK